MITKNSFKAICSKTLSMNCISSSSNPAERALWLSSLFKMNAEKHLARGPIIGARKDGKQSPGSTALPSVLHDRWLPEDKNKPPPQENKNREMRDTYEVKRRCQSGDLKGLFPLHFSDASAKAQPCGSLCRRLMLILPPRLRMIREQTSWILSIHRSCSISRFRHCLKHS